jgi:hypothetical protein
VVESQSVCQSKATTFSTRYPLLAPIFFALSELALGWGVSDDIIKSHHTLQNIYGGRRQVLHIAIEHREKYKSEV